MLLAGAMNTEAEALRVWVRDCLAPLLRPGDIVIWDNFGLLEDPRSPRSFVRPALALNLSRRTPPL